MSVLRSAKRPRGWDWRNGRMPPWVVGFSRVAWSAVDQRIWGGGAHLGVCVGDQAEPGCCPPAAPCSSEMDDIGAANTAWGSSVLRRHVCVHCSQASRSSTVRHLRLSASSPIVSRPGQNRPVADGLAPCLPKNSIALPHSLMLSRSRPGKPSALRSPSSRSTRVLDVDAACPKSRWTPRRSTNVGAKPRCYAFW